MTINSLFPVGFSARYLSLTGKVTSSGRSNVLASQSFTSDISNFRRRKWVNRMGLNVGDLRALQFPPTFKKLFSPIIRTTRGEGSLFPPRKILAASNALTAILFWCIKREVPSPKNIDADQAEKFIHFLKRLVVMDWPRDR